MNSDPGSLGDRILPRAGANGEQGDRALYRLFKRSAATETAAYYASVARARRFGEIGVQGRHQRHPDPVVPGLPGLTVFSSPWRFKAPVRPAIPRGAGQGGREDKPSRS